MARSQKKREDDAGLMSDLARARLDRIKGGGLSGLQASTIGLALGGCTALGFFAGQWLDNRFGTSFLMPLMTMLGVAAGFREMLVTIRQVGRHAAAEKAEREAKRRTKVKNIAPSSSLRGTNSVADDVTDVAQSRIFKVPAPPQASFEISASPHMSTHAANENVTDENDNRSLTDRLLDLNDDRPSSQ